MRLLTDTVEKAQRADADTICSLLSECSVPVYYILGNDDFIELEPPSSQFHLLHERRVELEKWNLVGYQHSPTHGILDRVSSGEHVGSPAILETIERRSPYLHVHGHIHRAFGRDGRHFNVSAGEQCRAMLVDLKSGEHQLLREAR